MTTPDTPTSTPEPERTLTVYVIGDPLPEDRLAAFADNVPPCSTRNARKVRCAVEASVLVVLPDEEKDGSGLRRLSACTEHWPLMLNWLRKQGAEITE